jgi:hypothetical protein
VEDGATVQPGALTGPQGTVFLFWSNRCPWISRYEERVQDLVRAFQDQGIRFVRVNANDPADWPQESAAACRARAEERGYAAPYVRDPTAAFARALGATRTPHAFVFDGADRLVYAGAIDDSPADPTAVKTPYLRSALEAVVAGKSPSIAQTEPFGCTLKYP